MSDIKDQISFSLDQKSKAEDIERAYEDIQHTLNSQNKANIENMMAYESERINREILQFSDQRI